MVEETAGTGRRSAGLGGAVVDGCSPAGSVAGPKARELLLAGVALLAVLGLFFLTPLRSGHLLSPADLLLKSAPWRHGVNAEFEPANALLSDYVYQFRPWQQYTTAALRSGRLPLWNPDNAGGLPFLGAGISAVLYPLNLPFFALPGRPTRS